jgi:methionyl-tRNA formyltransferase
VPLAVVYAGTPDFAVPALEAIVRAGHRVAAVYSQPDRPAGRGRQLAPSAVKRAALALGLPVLQPVSLREPDSATTLAAFAPDVMVVAAYGLLLPPAVLAVPRFGCVNIHASLLPRWRGAAPVQRAILDGDARTGVAIMRMEAGLDTGPVYDTVETAIGPAETAGELTARLAELGAAAVLETLTRLEAGTAVAVPQPGTGVLYARKLEKSEAALDWRRPAIELERQIRAFQPWPVADTGWGEGRLRIHEAVARDADGSGAPGTIVAIDGAGFTVATGSGVLVLRRVQQAGRNVVSAAEFARSEARHGRLVGQRFVFAGAAS